MLTTLAASDRPNGTVTAGSSSPCAPNAVWIPPVGHCMTNDERAVGGAGHADHEPQQRLHRLGEWNRVVQGRCRLDDGQNPLHGFPERGEGPVQVAQGAWGRMLQLPRHCAQEGVAIEVGVLVEVIADSYAERVQWSGRCANPVTRIATTSGRNSTRSSRRRNPSLPEPRFQSSTADPPRGRWRREGPTSRPRPRRRAPPGRRTPATPGRKPNGLLVVDDEDGVA